MCNYGVYEWYLKPSSDSLSSDSTASSDTESDSEHPEDVLSIYRRQSRVSSKTSSPSSDSKDLDSHPSSSVSSKPPGSGSPTELAKLIHCLFQEEGVRAGETISRKYQILYKRLIEEISSLGITTLDLQNPLLLRLLIDKWDNFISVIRKEISATVSRSQLPAPSRRHLEDVLLAPLESLFERSLGRTWETLIDDSRQQDIAIHGPRRAVYSSNVDVDTRLKPETPPSQDKPVEQPISQEPIEAEAPEPIEGFDNRRKRKERFWNHTTISRDQTSASNFVTELLLSVLRKRNNHGAFESLDWDAEQRNSLTKSSTITVTQRHLDSLPHAVPGHQPGLTPSIEARVYDPGNQSSSPRTFNTSGFQGTYPFPGSPSNQAQASGQAKDPIGWSLRLRGSAASISYNQDNGADLQQVESYNINMAEMVQHQPDISCPGSLEYLMEKIHFLEAQNKSFKESQGHPVRIQTLYTISEKKGAGGSTFLDEPTWVIGPRGQAMLKAHYPIPDTNGYLSQQHDVAFVIMKFYDLDEQGEEAADAHRDKRALPRPQPTTELIRLESMELKEAVEAFLAQQPKFVEDFPNFNIKNPISAPYLFWYHYGSPTALDGLSASYADTMKILTSWIDEHYGGLYSLVRSQLSRGVTSVETMEFLFKPGEVLLWEEKNDMVAAIASSWPTVRFKPSSKSISRDSTWKKGKGYTTDDAALKWKWQVNTWQYHYDGSFQRINRMKTIVLQASSPTEEVPIVKLSPYPLKHASDAVRSRLQHRGETFWRCRFRRLVSYKDEKGLVGTGERFMIDFETYEQLHSDSTNFKDIYGKFEENKLEPMDSAVMASDNPPDAPEIYVFPPKITGYNLRSKKWDDLTVDLIQDVVWNKKSFEHLVIDFETKELVQALVTNQIDSEQSTDIIEQKGNGLTILLHGGPGTGKTYTAESVAEMAEKPLFRVTCGDIGTKPEVVEKYLESVLYLGKRWGCVVLLDEADVFLEQRTLTDLERNALVSVFLRVLEYYEGILILTSNRVGTFDEAFKSRIHLALHYQNLTEGQRKKIWKNFFNRLKDLDADSLASSSERGSKSLRTKPLEPLKIDFDDVECYLTELATYELNGRQIRNAITIARNLTKSKNEKMAFHHLKHVITVIGKFDAYLQNVQEGFTDDQVARGGGIR